MEKMSKVQTEGPVTTVDQFKKWDKLGIIKNILIISFGFMIANFANSMFDYNYFPEHYDSNYTDGVIWAISIFVVVLMFTNYFILRKSKIKLSIWISMIGFTICFLIKGFGSGYFLIHVVANFFFRMCSAQLWVSCSSYLLDLAKEHKYFGKKSLEIRAIRFLGVLNCFYQLAFVLSSCWYIYIKFKPTYDEQTKTNAIISTILPVVSALLVIIFLDGITNDEISSPTDEEANTPNKKSVVEDVLKFFKQIKLLLIPITVWVGLRSILISFVWVLSWGYNLNTEIICYGLISASTSLVLGIVIKYCTRCKIFCAAALIDIAVIISLIVLNFGMVGDYANNSRKTFVVAIMMFEGIAGAIWDTVLPAFYGVVSSDDSALSTFSKYFGIKYTGVFVLSVIKWIGLYDMMRGVHWEVLVAMLIVIILAGMLGYFRIEFQEQKKKNSTRHSNPLPELHEQKGANV